jgi:hypothetical protein
MLLPRLIVRPLRHGSLSGIGHFSSTGTLAAPVPEALLRLQSLQTESDHSAARTWLDDFQVEDIPKEAWEAGYSRSSGPGGQVSPSLCSIALHHLSTRPDEYSM